MHKFLIIQTAFIGDVVLATAVAEKLHSFYPEATIDFLLRKGNEMLLKEHPFLRKVYVWNKKEGKIKGLFRIAKEVHGEHYTHVINLHRFAASGFVTWFSGAKGKIGYDKNPFSWTYTKVVAHKFSNPGDAPIITETIRNQWLIEALTDDIPAKPRLYPTAKDYEKIKEFQNQHYICIAPSSVWFTKRFPVEQWIELVKGLPQKYKIYFLSGPEDAAMATEIIDGSGHKNAINLGGKLTFMESAALMQFAAMNYTNDSGPLHFASSVNAPSTAIFCSTDPCYGFGPQSDDSTVVQVAGLYCKPCGIHGYDKCPEGHFRCAKDIRTEDLLKWISNKI